MGNCVCVKTSGNENVESDVVSNISDIELTHLTTGIIFAERIRRDSFGNVYNITQAYRRNSNSEQSVEDIDTVEIENGSEINDMESVYSDTDINGRNSNHEGTPITNNIRVVEVDIGTLFNDQIDEMVLISDVESESESGEDDIMDDNLNISFEEEIDNNKQVYIDGETCSICVYSYDNEDHIPQILPCGHTLCMFCIRKISRRHKYRYMTCPLDRKRHDIKTRNTADDNRSIEADDNRSNEADDETLTDDSLQNYEPRIEPSSELENIITPRTFHPRLCIMRKWRGSQSYGFEIAFNGYRHFISAVDANSQAEDAGLHIGDRVIEVNGVSMQNCTHHEVIEKMRKYNVVLWMLVVDDETDDYFREEGINVTADMSQVVVIEAKLKESVYDGLLERQNYDSEDVDYTENVVSDQHGYLREGIDESLNELTDINGDTSGNTWL